MSQLPLHSLVVNVTKNKINDGPDMIDVTATFEQVAHSIKERSINV